VFFDMDRSSIGDLWSVAAFRIRQKLWKATILLRSLASLRSHRRGFLIWTLDALPRRQGIVRLPFDHETDRFDGPRTKRAKTAGASSSEASV